MATQTNSSSLRAMATAKAKKPVAKKPAPKKPAPRPMVKGKLY